MSVSVSVCESGSMENGHAPHRSKDINDALHGFINISGVRRRLAPVSGHHGIAMSALQQHKQPDQ